MNKALDDPILRLWAAVVAQAAHEAAYAPKEKAEKAWVWLAEYAPSVKEYMQRKAHGGAVAIPAHHPESGQSQAKVYKTCT